MKQILINIVNYFSDIKYQVGFFISDVELVLSHSSFKPNISWLKTGDYKAGWFADPFILSENGNEIRLLVEEYIYDTKKGRISLLVIKRKGSKYILSNVSPLYELNSHLSFPYIFRDEDNIYLCPENYQSGKVILYKYCEAENLLEPFSIIIDKPLVDVQIAKINGYYYAMGVLRINGEMTETKELLIYRSSLLNREFDYFQTIKNDLSEERGAGQIFMRNSRIIRPAQCCEGGYGTNTILYELSFDPDGKMSEREICRVCPQKNKHFGLSLHTFNFVDNVFVVDGHDNKNLYKISRFIAPVLDKIWKCSKNH